MGDQLSEALPAVGAIARGKDMVLMAEVKGESTHVQSHKQRTVLFLSAMRHFAKALEEAGHKVRYVTLDDPANSHGIVSELDRAAAAVRPSRVVLTRPGEHRLRIGIENWAKKSGIPLEMREDATFFTTRDQFRDWAEGRKALTMEFFYREQRKRLGVLMEVDGTPVGGAWNFDADNRLSFKRDPLLPQPRRFVPDEITGEVIAAVEREMPNLPGRIDRFDWPVTASEANAAWQDFLRARLRDFGPYEDAMWTGQPWVYHAQMSPAMNLKLIDPRGMLKDVLAAGVAGRGQTTGKVPLQSVEGFVRQIIGWREFIRGVYELEGPEYEARNTLNHTGDLPEFYWTGETDMNCMRQCIGQVLDHGYGHHIQRLMVTGNFALVAGVHPKKVSNWYLGMYVDGVDWVTLPNTLGMSQHADGGVVGTKPYAASANYIGKMSNYCKGCRYDPKQRTGENACPFNTLYWDFMIRHKQRFSKNQRMSMMVKNVDRMSKPEIIQITRDGQCLKQKFGVE
ncbi:MAG: cryptochrome/photolyase family protein [Phycisphaerales bacterium]